MSYFKITEFLQSNKAKELGIDLSNPPQLIRDNIEKIMMPKCNEAHEILNTPIVINSGWRPLALNTAIKGSKTSAHIYALGADMAPRGMSIEEAFKKLSEHPSFMRNVDQLIIERGCIHLGMRSGSVPRRELRREVIANGKFSYPLIRVWEPAKR